MNRPTTFSATEPRPPEASRTVTFCRQVLLAVGQLRRRLRAEYLGQNVPGSLLVRQSLAEAEELAWETSFPHLFLPLLAEEKVRLARARR